MKRHIDKPVKIKVSKGFKKYMQMLKREGIFDNEKSLEEELDELADRLEEEKQYDRHGFRKYRDTLESEW